MAKNHYVTKAKRRNRSGKRKDTKRIAANMAEDPGNRRQRVEARREVAIF